MDNPITPEQIKQWQDARVKAASDQIREALEKYNCELLAVPLFTSDGRVSAQIAVVAR